MQMVPDQLWAILEPLLPDEPAKPKGCRPRVADRVALAGILFVLRTGCGWSYVPYEMACGCGATCWRRAPRRHARRFISLASSLMLLRFL